MFQGLRTVIYHVADLNEAKAWYAKAFATQPYFDEPFYVGFSVGGYELGLHPAVGGVSFGNNAVAYWGVPDIDAAVAHMKTCGAVVRQEPMDVGGDIKVAAVADPFGNVIGIIQNPHFKIP